VFLAEKFSQVKFSAGVAFLSDVVDSLNCLNRTMQGPVLQSLIALQKSSLATKKLIFWKRYVS